MGIKISPKGYQVNPPYRQECGLSACAVHICGEGDLHIMVPHIENPCDVDAVEAETLAGVVGNRHRPDIAIRLGRNGPAEGLYVGLPTWRPGKRFNDGVRLSTGEWRSVFITAGRLKVTFRRSDNCDFAMVEIEDCDERRPTFGHKAFHPRMPIRASESCPPWTYTPRA